MLGSPVPDNYRVAKTFLKKSKQKSVHFQKKSVQFSKKKSVQSVHFFLKIRTLFKNSVHFIKNPYNQYNFRKKIPAICTFKKNKTIFENIVQHCLTPPFPTTSFSPHLLTPSNNLYSW